MRFIARQSTPKTFEVFDTERGRTVRIPPSHSGHGTTQTPQMAVRDRQRAEDWAADLNLRVQR